APSATSLSTTSAPGCSSRKARRASGISSAAAVWDTPTRTGGRFPPSASSASKGIASTSPSARRARRQTASPAGVSRTCPRPPRMVPIAEGRSAVTAAGVPGPGKLLGFRVLAYALVLASSGTQFAVVPVIPDYAQQFGLSGLQQGLVLGATGLATLAVSLPAG